MYLDLNRKCPAGAFFDVPHLDQPMTAKEIIKKFPKFAKLFDGQSQENTLSFYYKKSKQTGVYEFISCDDEEEVAELMGVEIKTFVVKNENALDDTEIRELDDTDIKKFREHMADIRTGLMWLNSEDKEINKSDNDSSDSDSSSDSE